MPLDDLQRERRAFLCPVSPSANALFINAGRKRIKSPAYKAWITEAGWRIKLQGVQPLPGKSFALTIAAPVNHARDLGNVEKALSDLLVSMGIIPDDRWIDSIRLDRMTEGKEMWVTLKVLA